MVAHGVSRGASARDDRQPRRGERKRPWPLAATILEFRLAFRCLLLSPLWGLSRRRSLDPRLTPWATILRRYAAGTVGMVFG
jgi:hypothetical protein